MVLMRKYSGYIRSILSAIIIILALRVSVCIYGELKPVIAAVGGLLFSVPIRFFWESYKSPILKIKGEPEIRDFFLKAEPDNVLQLWIYKANRIIVENTGRSAAKNCKGYIILKNVKERVCWTVPKERPNATINAKDEEKLDFCAFYKSGLQTFINFGVNVDTPMIIAPTEEGWPTLQETHPGKCKRLDGIEKEECEVLVTADNTEPVKAKIRFNVEERKISIEAN